MTEIENRPRPFIPLSVRVAVAERQVRESGSIFWPLYAAAVEVKALSLTERLKVLLDRLVVDGMIAPQLDHDPALILREFKPDKRKTVAAWYAPNANDPDHLVYRSRTIHLQKTIGRKHDAEKTVTTKGSDIWLKTKFKRLENPSTKPRSKIPGRPFPKGRPFPSRKPQARG